MRVVHVDLGREMRGGQHQALRLIEELTHRGIEQRLLGPHGEPFRARILREAAEIVHAHDARAHTWSALFAKAPLVVSRRVAFPIQPGWLSRWKYRKPALFLAVSKYVAGKLMDAGVPSSRIEIVYDGVPELPASTRTGGVIAPRTEDPMKGSDLIRASGIAVTFVNNLPEALRTAQAMLYVTRQEGLGSAALLAMSAGVPVIASRVGGLPEIVEHERTGLLIDNSPAAIAEAVRRMAEAGASDAWAAAARQHVRSRFLTTHMAAATLAAYEGILKS